MESMGVVGHFFKPLKNAFKLVLIALFPIINVNRPKMTPKIV